MIDLHTHTTFSDGSLTPTQLVAEASAKGLTAVAITDHDTVDGLPEGLAAGEAFGVRVVPGVEINLEHEGVTMDLLGYFLQGAPSDRLREALTEMRRSRDERNARILEKLAGLGFALGEDDLAEVSSAGAIGRPHIGEALRRRGYVGSIAEAFELLLRRGGPAWVDRRRVSLAAAIRLLTDSGGLPVLAHPGLIRVDAAGLERIVAAAAGMGIVGLECHYPRHDAATERRCLDLCARYGLAATGGSDYHGSIKPDVALGADADGAGFPDSLLADLERRGDALLPA